MVPVRKERKRTKGKRDNVSTFMEYKLWLKLSGAEATSISFLALKLTEDDFDNDAIACFMSADESEMIYISYSDVNGITLEAFQKQLSQNNISSKIINVNGIPALLYSAPDSNAMVAVYSTANGYFLQLIFFPYSNDFISVILSSVQPDVQDSEPEPVVPVNPISGLISK